MKMDPLKVFASWQGYNPPEPLSDGDCLGYKGILAFTWHV